jgi:hypothetical protein
VPSAAQTLVPVAAQASDVRSLDTKAPSEAASSAQPSPRSEVTKLATDEICKHDEDHLQWLSNSPTSDEAMRFLAELRCEKLEGADVSGVIIEGGEQDEGRTRATWRDHQRMLCGIHHTPQAKPGVVKRGPKIAPRDVVTAAAQAFARNEIDRAELMRRITPSLS